MRVTARAQWIMSGIEVAILVLFAVLAIVHSASHHVITFSWSWFGFSHFNGLAGFAAGGLIAAFYYWGWDVASNLNEEMKDSKRSAGIGGIIGVVHRVRAVRDLHDRDQPGPAGKTDPGERRRRAGRSRPAGLARRGRQADGDRGHAVDDRHPGDDADPGHAGRCSRCRGSGRCRSSSASILPGRQTPWLATIAVAIVSLGLFVGSNYIGSLSTILTDAISAIGLQICVYYGLAGLTVVVAFRKVLFKSVKNLVLIGIWPFVGAVFMFWILGEFVATNTSNAVVIWVGLGGLASA